jgi:hypothetical protein
MGSHPVLEGLSGSSRFLGVEGVSAWVEKPRIQLMNPQIPLPPFPTSRPASGEARQQLEPKSSSRSGHATRTKTPALVSFLNESGGLAGGIPFSPSNRAQKRLEGAWNHIRAWSERLFLNAQRRSQGSGNRLWSNTTHGSSSNTTSNTLIAKALAPWGRK